MIAKYDGRVAPRGFSWRLADIPPQALCAGKDAGCLTAEGALLLDPTGTLQPGIPVAPPEGDAGTGMCATNSVAPRHGQHLGGHLGVCHGGAWKSP